MKKYIELLRCKHWVKNILIFFPLFFSKSILNLRVLWLNIIGFIAFSFIASAIYIINDINDVNDDRTHPNKCKRPIASNRISIKTAVLICSLMIAFSVVLNFILLKKGVSIFCLISILVYFALNIIYSLGAKNIEIVDIFLLTSGYYIRVLYGGVLTGVTMSDWLYFTVLFMALFLCIGKRKNEKKFYGNNSRRSLVKYPIMFLELTMYMCLGLTIVFYSLWCKDTNHIYIYTVPFFVFLCLRYCYNIETYKEGDPMDVLFEDKFLIFLCIIYVLLASIFVYGLNNQL